MTKKTAKPKRTKRTKRTKKPKKPRRTTLWSQRIRDHCAEARQWVESFQSPDEAWRKCTNPIWLIGSISNSAFLNFRHAITLVRIASYVTSECVKTWSDRNPGLPPVPGEVQWASCLIHHESRKPGTGKFDYDHVIELLRNGDCTKYQETHVVLMCMHVARAHRTSPIGLLTMHTCLVSAVRCYMDLLDVPPAAVCDAIRQIAGRCHF